MQRGIIRKIDRLGRVTVPSAFRDILNVAIGDDIEIKCDNDKITIEKRAEDRDAISLVYLDSKGETIKKTFQNAKDLKEYVEELV